jgi:dsRNA-specific ribonuclease
MENRPVPGLTGHNLLTETLFALQKNIARQTLEFISVASNDGATNGRLVFHGDHFLEIITNPRKHRFMFICT